MAIAINKKRTNKSKSAARSRRQLRIRKRITGTAVRPRLVVNRSARHIFVQVVDDSKGVTVAYASTLEADLRALDDRGLAGVVLGMALYTGTLDPRIVAEEFAQ